MKAALFLEQKRRLDRKQLILAAIIAVLFHLWLLYFTFPVRPAPTYEEIKHHVRIRRWRPPEREKPKVKPPPPKKKVKKAKFIIPVPDPTPNEPEEIQPLEPEPQIEEIPPDEDFVWGIPEAPDVEVGQEQEQEAKIYNQWEVSRQPEILKEVKPSYPTLAQQVGKEAMVVLMLAVDEKGNVESHQVLHATGDKFKQQFIKESVMAAYKYKFKPAIQSGHPVPCWVKIIVRFKLRK
nr:energy transducer TonB [Bacillota bacterium]